MQLNRVRRTALVVAVVGAVGAIAATAGAAPGASGISNGSSVPSNGGSTFGATGATGPSGQTGATGATAPVGPTGPSAPTGSSDGGAPAPDTSTPPASTTPTAPAGETGPTGPTEAGQPLGIGTGIGRHRRHHHSHHATQGPSIALTGAQPQTASIRGLARHGHHGGAPNGPTAPPPSLFAGANPLAGVLPGSWSDPFIVPGGAEVPQFFVESFHIPPFLLAIYQSAGSWYGVPWQVLAAINEVETDYGTNLDVSSAGAIGWMQFLPSTWKRYGVDASGAGARDPYNAADAIFAAARYLAAAGASHNLAHAIFAYNHSHAYVQSVLDRAELLAGEPSALLSSLSELSEGDFPVQLRYHSSYRPGTLGGGSAPAAVTAAAGGTAPAPGIVGAAAAGAQRAPVADIYADSNAAVVAVQDSTVTAIGRSRKLGRYIVLRNAFGDRFTYAHLASVSAYFPAPRRPHPSRAILSAAVPAALGAGPRPTGPATAGAQPKPKPAPKTLFGTHARARTTRPAAPTAPLVATINLGSRPSATTLIPTLTQVNRALAGSRRHVLSRRRADLLLKHYFTGAFGLPLSALELARLHVGSHVLAGTILGRLAVTHGTRRPHLVFEVRPAGAGESLIDPRPFLDSWSQLETLELHRDNFATAPVYGPNLHARSVGLTLRASQVDLERIVLQDTRVTLPNCERSAIAAGNVDRRVLATLEVLVLHGIDPTVSGAWCSSNAHVRRQTPALLKTGNAVALAALDGRAPVASVAAIAEHALRTLPSAKRPALSEQLVAGRLVISFAPARQPQTLAVAASFTAGFALSSPRWSQLDTRLQQIQEPRVPTAISRAALRSARRASHKHH
jgi:murein DD-endopeptidase MepM/ murein hydrolase activator NlpD